MHREGYVQRTQREPPTAPDTVLESSSGTLSGKGECRGYIKVREGGPVHAENMFSVHAPAPPVLIDRMIDSTPERRSLQPVFTEVESGRCCRIAKHIYGRLGSLRIKSFPKGQQHRQLFLLLLLVHPFCAVLRNDPSQHVLSRPAHLPRLLLRLWHRDRAHYRQAERTGNRSPRSLIQCR